MAQTWYNGEKHNVRALMDTGATYSIITQAAVDRLGLATRKGQVVRLASINNKGVDTDTLADLCIKPHAEVRWVKKFMRSGIQLNVTAYVVADLGPANPVFSQMKVDVLDDLLAHAAVGLADYHLGSDQELNLLLGTVECSQILMGQVIRHKGLALHLTKFGYVVSGALSEISGDLREATLPGSITAPAAIIGDGEFDAIENGPTSRLLELVSQEDMEWEKLDIDSRLVEFQQVPRFFNVDHRQSC